MKILTWIRCKVFRFHNWTTDFEERGCVPLKGLDNFEEVKASVISDCRMYCKDCKHESELNKQLENW